MSLLDLFQRGKDARRQFDEKCVRAIRELVADAQVKLIEQGHIYLSAPGREPLNIFTDNIWGSWKGSEGNPAAQQEAFNFWIKGMVTPAPSADVAPPLESIVPQIKDELFFRQIAERFQKPPETIREHLVADLWVLYAVDLPHAITTLRPDHLEKLGIDPADLRPLALKNLRRLLPPPERLVDGSSYFMLTAGGDYVASLLLYDDVWDEQGNEVKGDVVAVAPSRDVILFTGSENLAGLTEMREATNRLQQSGGYLISDTFLRRKDNSWVAFS